MPKLHCLVKYSLLAICFLGCGRNADAQTLTENQRMRFGTIVMHDNSAQRDLQLLPGGGYVAAPGYYILDSGPQLGSYTIQGQLANWPMIINFSPVGAINRTGGPGPFFTLVNFFTVPATVFTDASGNATFQVGATLRSSGFMGGYPDDSYGGQYTIMVTPGP